MLYGCKPAAMQIPDQPANSELILRNASEPYLLLFEEGPYKLSTDALEAHADEKTLNANDLAGRL